MARFHLTYKEDSFDERIIALTKRFLHEKPWSKQPKDVIGLYRVWVHGACIVHELPVPLVVITPQPSGVGRYIPEQNGSEAMIMLHRPSMISLFHQYRHHMQAFSEGAENVYKSDEEAAIDCQRWATSLLYVVAPKRFRKMVRAGRVAGVYPDDLLKKGKK